MLKTNVLEKGACYQLNLEGNYILKSKNLKSKNHFVNHTFLPNQPVDRSLNLK